MHHDAMRMTEGSIAKQMLRFAAPLFLGNLFQQLYNTADALIVGNMLGTEALAAVSATGPLVFLIISLFVGISAGSGVLISRYFGAQDQEKLERAVHTNVAFSLVAGLLMTVFGVIFTPTILDWMDTPEPELSAGYIRIFFAGSMGLVLYNGLRGMMQAVGDGKNPLKYLIFCSCLNVVLDITFIGVFHAGVGGAALATIISQFLSGLLCLRRLMRTEEEYRVELKKIRSNINEFGTLAVAGCGAYSRIEGFAFLPITSFTISLTTFVGQNLGAREYGRAKKGARFGLLCAIGAAETIGLLVYLLSPLLLRAFTDDPAAIQYGVDKAHICSLFFFLLAASHGLAAVLRGAGKAVIPMISMLAFWCVIRVSFLHFMVPIYYSIDTVNWVYPLTWALSTVFLGIYYWRADWLHSFEKQNA